MAKGGNKTSDIAKQDENTKVASRNPDLDQMLTRFLRDQEENPIRETLKDIANNQITHEQKDLARHTEVTNLIAGHAGRLTAIEGRVARIEDKEEDTATRDRRTLELAAEARGIALGKRAPKSDPPALSLIARAAKSGVAKGVGLGVGALFLLFAGWLSRHIGLGVPQDAGAAEQKAAERR